MLAHERKLLARIMSKFLTSFYAEIRAITFRCRFAAPRVTKDGDA